MSFCAIFIFFTDFKGSVERRALAFFRCFPSFFFQRPVDGAGTTPVHIK